ncbi:hypothetical protein H632_c3481p0, partial [Helicosporidium sp. ATCC 50920]
RAALGVDGAVEGAAFDPEVQAARREAKRLEREAREKEREAREKERRRDERRWEGRNYYRKDVVDTERYDGLRGAEEGERGRRRESGKGRRRKRSASSSSRPSVVLPSAAAAFPAQKPGAEPVS